VKPAIYARVSTEDQDCEIQLTNLRNYVKRWEWPAAVEYVEKLSGKEGNRRPELERLMEDARQRHIDCILVWKLDRFGRSTLDTLENVRTLDRQKVRFLCPTMNVDTSDQSPIGRFTLTMFAAIAELERCFILERTQGGLQAYRRAFASGQVGVTKHSKSGKDLAVGRPRCVVDRFKVWAMHDGKASLREIAGKLNVGRMTVARILAGPDPRRTPGTKRRGKDRSAGPALASSARRPRRASGGR
jgi:DNA invertase Pin-like site-specific DNA recombinase